MIIVLQISSLQGIMFVRLVKQNGRVIYRLGKRLALIEVDDEYRIIDTNEIDLNQWSRNRVGLHRELRGVVPHDPGHLL